MVIYRKNLQHIKKFQIHYHNKYEKSRRYASGEKILFHNKYIKMKQNCNLNLNFSNIF